MISPATNVVVVEQSNNNNNSLAAAANGGSQSQQKGRFKKKKSKNQQQQQQQSTVTEQQQRSYQTIPGIRTDNGTAATLSSSSTPVISLSTGGAVAAPSSSSSSFAATGATVADASLRPNVGLTNRYADHALFGLALHTLLDYIRLANCMNATGCIVLALVTWFWNLVTLRLDKLVLLIYLLVLSASLLLVEVWSLFPQVLPEWNATIQNQFGLLYHPPGKACFLFILATLCFAIGNGNGIWECIFGLVYCCTSFCLIHSWCLYPELRNAYTDFNTMNQNDNDNDRAGSTQFEPIFASWSDYAPASTASLWSDSNRSSRGTLGERASLLYSGVMQRNEQSI